MSSFTWTWDPARKDYFYYSQEEEAWIYQKGHKVKQGTAAAKKEE
jgi:hypothetical protein